MKDYEAGLEILKQDIVSLIVTFETNFEKSISTINYENWKQSRDLPVSINDIGIYIVNQ